MTAQHTPGPWRSIRVGANVRVYAGKELIGVASPKSNPVANARLIAAAPELLEAVRDLADDLESELRARYDRTLDHPAMAMRFERDMAPVVAARSAIAKAEGR